MLAREMDKPGGHQSTCRTAAMASLKVSSRFAYQAAVRGTMMPIGM